MTLVTDRLSWGTGANGGIYFLYATWDDVQEQENGTFLDPNADMLVRSIRYQNMTAINKTLLIAGQSYSAPAGTPDTTVNLPAGKRPRIDASSWSVA